jgi:hypothetical protein
VFENRVRRRIFGPRRDEVTGGWRKLHNEELHNLYSSPSIIRMIKSRRVRWAGHVPEWVRGEKLTKFWQEKQFGINVILKCILNKQNRRMWTGFIWLRV